METAQPNIPEQESIVTEGRFKNKTPLLIIVLTILTALLVVLAVPPKSKNPTPSPSEQEMAARQATLNINSPVALGDGRYQADVIVKSGDLYANGADLYLTFDPNVLSNVVISKGSFIENPVELINKVDLEKGTITYSIVTAAGTGGVKGNGTLAVITFSVIGTPSAATSINFADNTDVTSETAADSILKVATGVTFNPGQ